MKSLMPALGPEGLALVLTAMLIFGTKETKTGKAKPLGWWWVLILSLIAGASYVAAGWPFDIVPTLVMGDLVGVIAAIKPGLSLPAIGLTLMVVLAWVGLTRRQVAVIGIILFYLLAGSGGGLGILAERIRATADHFAS
ncbi:hypothetical protein ACFOOM_01125 [Streptomyces echinoruber]|uniref:Uncharacterized protein n=1 Tax=Streptomyces echinoruber TaxID=68898 RepID=A0A918V6H8_9ACTN|nr:hypothetical protein [Streptomyces echinoruber]GGZ73045.1 hypothetical protein GCM10010389_08080 [Streptomyces echinoruber]